MNDEDDRTTILMVDDHALVREGLREILETQEDMRVVGEAGDGATSGGAGRARAARHRPARHRDSRRRGHRTVSQIRNALARSQVIILSMYEGPQLVQALLAAGIRGYLLKSIHWQELVVAIRAVHADSDRVVLGVSRESLRHIQQGPPPGTLSARERRSARPGRPGAQQRPDRVPPGPDRGDGQAAPQEHLRQARGGVPSRCR